MKINKATLLEQVKKLKKHGLGDVFLSSVFCEMISFLISVFVVRILSKEDYGYYAIAYNIYGYISVFVGCGLSNGILQYCSESRAESEKSSIYDFCRKFGTVFNIALLLAMPLLSLILLGDAARPYFVAMSGWPLVAYFSNYYLMRLRVKKDNRHFMLSNVISATVFLGSSAILAEVMGVMGYIIALYIKYAVSFVTSAYFLNKHHGQTKATERLTKKLKTEIVKYSLICCLTNFASHILILADVTCVNLLVGEAAAVATYKTAAQIPTALMFIPSSIIVFVFPYLAQNNRNYLWLKRQSKNLLAGILGINTLISFAVFLLAPVIVRILWGTRYLDAVPVLRILTINFLVTGSFNMVFGNIMVAVKKVNVNLVKTVVCSCLNIALDIVLINCYGSVGAALATLTVSICSSTFSVIYYKMWIRKKLIAEGIR